MEEKKEYKFNCEKCDYHSNNNMYYLQHKRSKKHQRNYKEEIEIENEKNKNKKYQCKLCNFFTDKINSFSQHKRTKKHKKNEEENKMTYNCEECNGKYKTNNQSEFMKHYKEKHMKKSDYKRIHNIINNTNSNNNTTINNNDNRTINNILNIHLDNDKESFQLMLNGLNNLKFIEMLGGAKSKEEFDKLMLWKEENIQNNFLKNMINKTLDNKTENNSISDLKITGSDKKNNIIQLKNKEKNKYNKYDSNFLLGNILENNLKLTKNEHEQRIINDLDYRKCLLYIDSHGNNISFKNGYEFTFNDILKDIIKYTEISIHKMKNGLRLDNKPGLEEQIDNFKNLIKYFDEFKKKIEIMTTNNN
jgi:hypothetical protein